MSVKTQIQTDLKARLETIKTANGYPITVYNVYNDAIPLAMDLQEFEVPAILILNGKDTPKHEHQWIRGQWLIHLQLIHKKAASDEQMAIFKNSIYRAIYANSPTIERNGEFRKIGASTQWHIVLEDPDLNMIDVNRMTEIVFEVQYHCHPTQI